jgi:nitrite reductase (NADH) large subunit
VSGCVRECAEAQGKDFGLIATEKGWNLYVGGNGGASPRHAELLASDVDEETAIRYLDRLIMFYVRTADRLTRTSVWLEKLDGGIAHLRRVIVDDVLGIAGALETEMAKLVGTYQCEWANVVSDPAKREQFRHFANDAQGDPTIQVTAERGQLRPSNDTERPAPVDRLQPRRLPLVRREWVRVARALDVPADGGIAVKYGDAQIALFHFASRGEWYATQNLCPHKREMVLARGLLGDEKGMPKVACPLHKKTFHLGTGACLTGEALEIATFPVRLEDGDVWVELPPLEDLRRGPEAPACPTEVVAAE